MDGGQGIVIQIFALVLAVCFHEAAHGWVAWRNGDPTAKLAGRITLNPHPAHRPVRHDPLPGDPHADEGADPHRLGQAGAGQPAQLPQPPARLLRRSRSPARGATSCSRWPPPSRSRSGRCSTPACTTTSTPTCSASGGRARGQRRAAAGALPAPVGLHQRRARRLQLLPDPAARRRPLPHGRAAAAPGARRSRGSSPSACSSCSAWPTSASSASSSAPSPRCCSRCCSSPGRRGAGRGCLREVSMWRIAWSAAGGPGPRAAAGAALAAGAEPPPRRGARSVREPPVPRAAARAGPGGARAAPRTSRPRTATASPATTSRCPPGRASSGARPAGRRRGRQGGRAGTSRSAPAATTRRSPRRMPPPGPLASRTAARISTRCTSRRRAARAACPATTRTPRPSRCCCARASRRAAACSIPQEFRAEKNGGWCRTGCHAPKGYRR